VAAEFKRSGKNVFQILQDFGVMDCDTILQVIANHLAPRWSPFAIAISPPN
jgi:hypothetical protein